MPCQHCAAMEQERDHWRGEAKRAVEAANSCIKDHNALVDAHRRLGVDLFAAKLRISELERLLRFHASKNMAGSAVAATAGGSPAPAPTDRFQLIELD